MIRHQLHQVLVRGHQHHVQLVLVTSGQGPHDVVGLEVLDAQKRYVEGFRDALEVRHLCAQGIGHLGSGALVLGIHAVSEGAALRVPGDGQIVRALVAYQLEQHVGEAEEGVGRQPPRIRHAADRVEGPKRHVRPVNEVQRFTFLVVHVCKCNHVRSRSRSRSVPYEEPPLALLALTRW